MWDRQDGPLRSTKLFQTVDMIIKGEIAEAQDAGGNLNDMSRTLKRGM